MSGEKNQNADESPVDAGSLVGSARAWVSEFAEEGLVEFERLPDLPGQPAATPPAPAASAPTVSSQPARDARPAHVQPAPTSKSAKPPLPAEPQTSHARVPPSVPGIAEATPWGDTRPSLEAVRDFLGDCERCGLCDGRQTIVFGEGNPDADLMFIGEGPGEQEDRTGRPFVGRAGELLTQMIEKGIGLSRDEVYIANIVKCRPPRNRNPLPPEVAACRPFLDGQIRAIAPKVIVTLGKPAASLLLERDVAITRERGTWQDHRGIPLMPTLHPAYVLRQYTAENRRAVWQDLQSAVERSRS